MWVVMSRTVQAVLDWERFGPCPGAAVGPCQGWGPVLGSRLMVTSGADLEDLLAQLGRDFEEVDAGRYQVAMGPGQPSAMLRFAPPVLTVRVEVGSLSGKNTGAVLRKLLELNALDLVHTAYGVEGEQIVLTSAHALQTLDATELEATLADMDLALVVHVPKLIHIATAKD